jgi:thioredoxin 1
MGTLLTVTDESFAADVESRDGLTIVDFTATWCGPCRILAPILEEVAAERAGSVRVAKLDMDENLRTVTRFNVRSAPTLLFFRGGRPVAQIVGAVPKHRIDAVIEQHA